MDWCWERTLNMCIACQLHPIYSDTSRCKFLTIYIILIYFGVFVITALCTAACENALRLRALSGRTILKHKRS
jgi:hypothetical protein